MKVRIKTGVTEIEVQFQESEKEATGNSPHYMLSSRKDAVFAFLDKLKEVVESLEKQSEKDK